MDPEHNWVTGLPSSFLQVANIDYANTLRVLSGSRIREFRLCIRGSDHPPHDDASNLLQNIISATPNLENLDLSFREPTLSNDSPALFDAGFLHRQCSNLKHLTFRAINVDIVWLFEVITQTTGLQSCVLNMIDLLGNGEFEYYAEDIFFGRVKSYFAAAGYRGPQFTWIQASAYAGSGSLIKFCEVLDDHLNAFVYDGGETPFNSVADADAHFTDHGDLEPYKPWSRRIEVLENAVWHYKYHRGSIDRSVT